ncbi:hypothetical protein Tco_0150771 [Tanacetum coccineum]
MAGTPQDWLKFKNRDFSINSRKEFRNNYKVLLNKEIEGPEALDYTEFSTLQEGRALQALEQLCHVIFRHDGRTFTSQAWNMLFRIREQVIRDWGREEEYNAKVKITLEDLFFLHSMDGREMVDVPWNVAKFLSDKAKGYKKKSMIVGAHLIGRIVRSYGLMSPFSLRVITLGLGTSLLNTIKLVELGICKYNALGIGELVDDRLDNSEDEAAAAEARRAQDKESGVRHYPNLSFTNRLQAMDERMRDMDTNIFKLSYDVEELTAVVSGMSEKYDQFYGEFNTMREEQQRFYSWEMDHLSQLLAHHHISHTCYDSTKYSYVPNIPDLGVQQGVNFMASPQDFSTTPATDPFGSFRTPDAGPSTSQNPRNDMDEE